MTQTNDTNDNNDTSDVNQIPWDDPVTQPFWEGALRRELRLQRCTACGHHQLYPRPFCLSCESDEVEWVVAGGTGTVYSQTEVHVQLLPELTPPYLCAVVDLDEGPRLLTNIVGPGTQIGDRVRFAWRDREGMPPVAVFERVAG